MMGPQARLRSKPRKSPGETHWLLAIGYWESAQRLGYRLLTINSYGAFHG
jgi:hypothetical protein